MTYVIEFLNQNIPVRDEKKRLKKTLATIFSTVRDQT